ncbi:MAG: hypothetical protein QF486_02945 [Candidatus Woesearchaeota archaeon]|jgi:hypothetical protein|nr:hypothetical protein [Candidatus Woesearchaeota archaeon]MDP7181512.1 hypothetical protein [Candidatus Woesearchaeota archaeon]MDP7198554.1 hypothetical protein [Candidatus Woesearchaeota archaeon]MDP7466704.1 hypothetical protein [Candidatus Woesearchaeota archaeon]MDP7647193.1 hypothetical protein [Candidatus Woesearchaeota archaeon]
MWEQRKSRFLESGDRFAYWFDPANKQSARQQEGGQRQLSFFQHGVMPPRPKVRPKSMQKLPHTNQTVLDGAWQATA